MAGNCPPSYRRHRRGRHHPGRRHAQCGAARILARRILDARAVGQPHGLLALIRDGWLRDAHPPVFSAWATLLGALGIDSIATGRVLSNLFGAGLMLLAARRLSRRMPGQAGFSAALLLLVLSLPQAIEAFATYRSYFWQIAAMTTLGAGRPSCRLGQGRSRPAPRRRGSRDRRDGGGGLDRAALYRRAVRRPAGRRNRAFRVSPRPAAVGTADAGDDGAGGRACRRDRGPAGAQLGGRVRP